MPVNATRRQVALLLPLMAALGCRGSKEDTGPTCEAPVANAGDDQSVALGTVVQLDASGSEICESTAADAVFAWSFVTVPTDSAVDDSSLSDNRSPAAVSVTFMPDVAGTYALELVVSDPNGESAPDVALVTVTTADAAPVADCGGAYTGRVGEPVQLDGSGSYDPEGATLEYSWSLVGVPDCSDLDSGDIYNADGPTPAVVPDCGGIFTVGLVVSDGVQYSDATQCTIEVEAENRAPVADAGESRNLGACADNPIELDGYGSYDPDGDDITYQWSVLSVPADSSATDANFDDPTSPTPRFAWDVAGEYTFQLQVSDGELTSAPDVVILTIEEPGQNESPIANAGEDQTVEVTADCTTASYVWTCDDCEAQTVTLDGTASEDPDGDTLSFTWTESTGTLSIADPHTVVTSATIPAQAAEYGVDNTMTLEVELEAADCTLSDTDRMTITYTCTGEAAR